MIKENQPQFDNEVDLIALASGIWKKKGLIFLISILPTVPTFFYAQTLPDSYQAKALVAPAESPSGGMGSVMTQYSGLASLAGISLPGAGDASASTLAIEVIKSRAFAGDFIDKYNLLPYLAAYKYWDSVSESDHFVETKYDSQSKTWTLSTEGFELKPSDQVAHMLLTNTIAINQSNATGLVTISVSHQSPTFASFLANQIIEEINLIIKSQKVLEARKSIDYLELQINKTTVRDLQQILYSLIKSQTETIMLAEVRPEYVFKFIDPAVAPESPIGPNRNRLTVISLVLGFFLGVIVASLQHFRNQNASSVSSG